MQKYVCAQTTPQHIYNVDLNLLVGVMTFTFSPLHCFHATIIEGGAADRRRRPILVLRIFTCLFNKWLIMHQPKNRKPAFILFFRQSGHHFRGEKMKKSRLSVHVHMRFKYEVKISDRNSQN